MSQDYNDNIPTWANQTDTDVTKIKNNFAALKSTFSGTTAPSDAVAGMWWYDTTAHILKVRNEANNAWLSVWDLANNKPIITNLSNEITGTMIAAALKSPAAGTEGLRKLGTGATDAMPGNVDLMVTQAKLANYTAGDNLIISSDGQVQVVVTTYTKVKEFMIIRDGTLRIKFHLAASQSGVAVYGRIYRNGVAVGNQRSTSSVSGVTFSEDIAGWSAYDLVQLYICTSNLTYPVYASNFRLYTGVRLELTERENTV